jgi:uncharacterized iron-regulated membrane protein
LPVIGNRSHKKGFSLSRKTWHFIHKWIAITVGVFILVWTVSGILMILPDRWFGLMPLQSTGGLEYSSVTVSPAEAIQNLSENEGKSLDVTWVTLSGIDGMPVYQILLKDGSSHLINATSGQVIKITSQFAERIIRDQIPTEGKPTKIEYLENHDLLYPYGSLPVYRITVDGYRSSLFYVSPRNGVISQSNELTRIRALISSLHTFEPVRFLSQIDGVRKGLLLLFSLVGIAAALTGYYLAVLPLFSRRSRRKKLSTSNE